MQETTESGAKETCSNVINELCDAVRYLGDASYAILPRDVAHALGDLKKSFLKNVSTLIEKDIKWTDERVAGGIDCARMARVVQARQIRRRSEPVNKLAADCRGEPLGARKAETYGSPIS